MRRRINSLSMRATLGGKGGYTLTEMLVVIAIIGLIAAVLTPGLIGQLGRARAKTAQLQLDTVVSAVETFRSDVGRYPTNDEGLQALMVAPQGVDGWTGPYVKSRKSLVDPWGHSILYKGVQDTNAFQVISYGADGKPGGTGVNQDIIAPDQK